MTAAEQEIENITSHRIVGVRFDAPDGQTGGQCSVCGARESELEIRPCEEPSLSSC